MKVLIVDDDDISLELLRTALESADYEVESASNGRQALMALSRGDIQLVITDWEMPEMDGLALCQEIRRRASLGYVYIILLTSHSSSREIVVGMTAGADDFIIKPFNQPELMARLRAGIRVLSLETREMVIFAMAKLAESRDHETGCHLERVQHYSRRLAEGLAKMPRYVREIDGDFIRLVFQTSPLHDVGKVSIPDHVLLKPGRLTCDEFEIMKSHTTIGADTLESALAKYPQAPFLTIARDIALSHHERWDGTGYPHGLRGEEIPLAARIVAVADVYDALTSRRVYKNAYSHETARDIIVADSEKHFDPNVVTAFLGAEQDFISIRKRFSDSACITAPEEMELAAELV